MTRRLKTVGWYLFDVARSRHTNPARIPVSDFADRYNRLSFRCLRAGSAAGTAPRTNVFWFFFSKKNTFFF
jgi:hypothetical protein